MREKILVVEDDPAALRLVSFTLESAGYKVIPAVNGFEGLRKAQEEAAGPAGARPDASRNRRLRGLSPAALRPGWS